MFSFSDNPDPAYFFTALSAWLDPKQDPSFVRVGEALSSTLSFRALQLLSRCSSLLLVLDELERVQDPGTSLESADG